MNKKTGKYGDHIDYRQITHIVLDNMRSKWL